MPRSSPLTHRQRSALVVALTRGIPIDSDDVAAATLRSLADRGLIRLRCSRKRKDRWRATDTGRGLIAASGLIPVFLHRRSQYGYTAHEGQAMHREPEAVGAFAGHPN